MQSSFKITDDILIVSIAGEIDHHSAGRLREDIDDYMKKNFCRNLIMDMEKVSFMDSSGIGVVLGRYNRLLQKNGRMIITGCSEYVEKILFMAGVFSLVEKAEDTETAVSILNGQEQIKLEVIDHE